MDTDKRLAALGIELPTAAAALASYVQTVRQGDVVYVSGQLPLIDGKLIKTGKLGTEVSLEQGMHAARQCAINALSVLKAEVGNLSRISRIVKLTGFIASSPEFSAHPQVINGASELLLLVFGDAGRHACSVVGVANLPLNAPIEIEMIVGVV